MEHVTSNYDPTTDTYYGLEHDTIRGMFHVTTLDNRLTVERFNAADSAIARFNELTSHLA